MRKGRLYDAYKGGGVSFWGGRRGGVEGVWRGAEVGLDGHGVNASVRRLQIDAHRHVPTFVARESKPKEPLPR